MVAAVVELKVDSGPTSERINVPSVVERLGSWEIALLVSGPIVVFRWYGPPKTPLFWPNMTDSDPTSKIPARLRPTFSNTASGSVIENVPIPLMVTEPVPTVF